MTEYWIANYWSITVGYAVSDYYSTEYMLAKLFLVFTC